ncbi:Mitotic exit network component, partial [Mycoemilia scoparia]
WGNRNSSVKTNKRGRGSGTGTMIAPHGIPISGGSMKYQLRQFAEATLGKKSLKASVALPEGEDLAEWVACHSEYEYLWADGETYKKATKMPAAQYIKLLMKWVNSFLDNPQVFPVDPVTPFNPSFLSQTAPMIFRRLLRVYAHLYYHHYHQISQVGLDTMLNTSFNHFTLFVTRWDMVGSSELVPVKDIIKSMI